MAREQGADLGEVRAQPGQLLADVGAVRPHRHLRGQARRVEGRVAQHGLHPLAQPGRAALHRGGGAPRHRVHVVGEGGLQARQLPGERGPFDLAPLDHHRQCRHQCLLQERPRLLRGERGLLLPGQHAGLTHHPAERGAVREVEGVGQLTRGVGVLPRLRDVDAHRVEHGAFEGRDGGADVHAAPLHGGLDEPPCVGFERGRHPRQLEGNVQVAVIDRPAFRGQDGALPRRLRPSVAGHAPNHSGLGGAGVRGNTTTGIAER